MTYVNHVIGMWVKWPMLSYSGQKVCTTCKNQRVYKMCYRAAGAWG
jgi:hypothetical protein